MIRCYIISGILHGGLLILTLVLSLLPAPAKQKRPDFELIRVRLGPPPGGGNKPLASLSAPGAPIPAPPVKTPGAEAAKKIEAPPPPPPEPEKPKAPEKKEEAKPVEKKAETQKKIIVPDSKIVEAVPKPKATATPKPEKQVASADAGQTSKTPPVAKAVKPPPSIDLSAIKNLSATPRVDTGTAKTWTVSSGKGPGGPLPPGPGIGAGGGGLGDNYAYMAIFMIQQNFKPPRMRPGVRCLVAFRIMRDGKIDIPSIKVKQGTGWNDLDQSAVKAISDTAVLPKLYEGFREPFMEAEITFEFEREP